MKKEREAFIKQGMDDSALAVREVEIRMIHSSENMKIVKIEKQNICKTGDQVESDQVWGMRQEQHNLPPGTDQVFHRVLISSSYITPIAS